MKAFTVSPVSRVYCYTEPVNMSYGFGKLPELVKTIHGFKHKDLAVFHNKKFNYIKVLYYDHGGFCMFCKKLDAGRFDESLIHGKITHVDMQKLVDTVLIHGKKAKTEFKKAA